MNTAVRCSAVAVSVLAVLLAGCTCGPGPGSDGGTDSGVADSGPLDGGPDSGQPDGGGGDGGPDAGASDGGDGGADAGADGGSDGGSDGGGDGGSDGGGDGGSDGGGDGGSDGGQPDGGPDAGCGCTPARCLSDGGCGECERDSQCAPAGVCDVAISRCAQCLPTNDVCDAGFYCLSRSCAPGCKGDSACASGLCLPSRDCFACRSNGECGGGRVCGTGVCSAPCDAGTCAASQECCSGTCVDVARDPSHCGGCGVVCGADSMCGRGHCQLVAVSNLCQLPVATAMLVGQIDDDDAGTFIADSLAASCAPAVTSRIASQLDSRVLNQLTGEPLGLGETLVAGGGSFRQRVVAWMEDAGHSLVTDFGDLAVYRYTLRDGGVVATGPVSALSPSHDVVVLQVLRNPTGGVVFNAAGYYGDGTRAAAWYVVNRVLPQLSTHSDRWYVVDWLDTNANLIPDAADTWTLLASGN